MLRTLATGLIASAFTANLAAAGPFIHDISQSISYAISLPEDNNEALPPAIVYLGGTGSMFQENVTLDRDTVVSYGGTGWRVMKYYNGSRDEADALCAEKFVNIIPYRYVYDTPEGEKPSYHWKEIHDIVEDARSKWPFDPNRLHLAGYSMGARAAWPILESDSEFYTSAAIISGTTFPDYDGLSNITQVPLRQYAGETDYEEVSQVYQHQDMDEHLKELGGSVSEVIVLNATHEQTQQMAFDTDLFNWFLSNTNNAADDVLASATSVQDDKADQYSSDMEAWSSWSKDNSFSLYADGFPTESRPATPTGDDAASNQNGGKDDDDDSSAFMASAPSVLLSGASSAVLFSLRSPRLALFATTLTAFAYFSK